MRTFNTIRAGVRCLGVVVTLLGGAVSLVQAADPADVAREADWNRRLERAEALQAEGQARRTEAEKLYNQRLAECAGRFLVNRCRDQARDAYLPVVYESNRLENEGKALAREVRHEQLRYRDAQRLAEQPAREAEQAARAKTRAEALAEHEDRVTRTEARKARQAEEGARRKAEAEARHRKRVAEHEARVAEQKARAAAKAAPSTPADASKPLTPESPAR